MSNITPAVLMRIVIAGGPHVGKSTAADLLGLPVRRTDDIIGMGWSEASAEAATWFDAPGPWVVEGVATPRALRKWLAAHPHGKPCDRVYWLTTVRAPLTKPGQAAMAKGCATVWVEIEPELRRRGVEILRDVDLAAAELRA